MLATRGRLGRAAQRGSDHLIALALAVLGLVTRWPLRSSVLDELDSAHYALAVLRFSLVESRPHPPGYVFFVWAAQALNQLTDDPVAALTAVSALAGALSVALLFELLAPTLGTTGALGACMATLFAPQVWLQQTRPMQDAFAFLWLVVLALATVAAARRLTLLAWTSVCALAGASGGAKQIVPLLAGGLILWLARQAWRQGGVRWMAAGCAAAAVAALTWIVPLSINCGSFRVYVQHALQQIAWQRHHDAVAFEGAPSRVLDRLAAAFAPAAHPPGLALALWLLAALGAVAAGRDHRLRWMLWLLAPLLLVRVLLLGPAPRFTIYYVPFVIALAVHGFAAVTRRLPRAGQRMAMAAAVSAWVAIQTHHVLPLLLALHEGPAPLESAVQTVRARMPVTDTLLLGSGGVLGRHLAYYAERHGLRSLEEDGEPRPATRVVQIAGSTQRPRTSWAWGGEPVGRWSLAVPNAQEVGPTGFVWDVTAVELHGPQVALRHWRVDAAGRRFATDTSRIVVFRPPGEDFGLRLQGRARGPVFFSIAGHRVAEWDGRGREYELRLGPARGRLAIDVQARCGGAADCFELEQAEAVPGRR